MIDLIERRMATQIDLDVSSRIPGQRDVPDDYAVNLAGALGPQIEYFNIEPALTLKKCLNLIEPSDLPNGVEVRVIVRRVGDDDAARSTQRDEHIIQHRPNDRTMRGDAIGMAGLRLAKLANEVGLENDRVAWLYDITQRIPAFRAR